MMVCYNMKMMMIRSVNLSNMMIMIFYQKIVILVNLLVLEICIPNIIGRGEFFSLVYAF